MPKLKTNKSIKKRFKITKNGKIIASHSLKRHMLTDRTPKNKRQARKDLVVDESHHKAIKLAMPYDA